MALLLVIYRHPADDDTPLEPLLTVTDQELARHILAHLYRFKRRCVCCGEEFVARRTNQIYCPPPLGLRHSPCSNRWRQRQLRKRRAAQAAV